MSSSMTLLMQCLGALCPFSLISTLILISIFIGGSRRRTLDGLSRGEKDEQPVAVICTGCKSEDTKLVDLEFDIYECTTCGAMFTRQPQEAQQ